VKQARWQQVEELFHRAAELPPAERPSFLAGACGGDEKLRRDVESLLAHDAQSGAVIGAAVGSAVKALPGQAAGEELVPGKQIGGYVITQLIGKGGMGLVFQARDTRLNRTVAIKALPPHCFADPERKRRFLQEAKAASALNHPNIVTIHGLAEENGMDFIVMEYVSGKTLDRLNSRKGLPLKRALKYSLEVADALAAAHAAGIVHRDIKPSNIMVTSQDRVKVLDFGLAKLTEPAGAEGPPNTFETEPGKVMGTAAYMSPEQAEGKPADARSDIFSFGALLYELVTGRQPFRGESTIRILSAILNQEPPPVRSLVADAPPEIEKVVARCLRKDPARRYQHMGDVGLALEETLEEVNAPKAPVASKPARRRWWLVLVNLALVLGLVLGVFVGDRVLHKGPVAFQRLTFRQGDLAGARFAPGGSIVYSAEWAGAPATIFSTQPGAREARDLGLPPAWILSVSRSGEMLIRLLQHSTLAQVPLAGGAPRELLEEVSDAAWDPSGNTFAVVRTVGARHRIEYPVGTVLYETSQVRPPSSLRISPNGDVVAFFDYSELGDQAVTIIGAKRPRRVLSAGWRVTAGLGWSPNGREIWFSGARSGSDPALYAVDLAGRERILAQMAGAPSLHDISTDGQLLLSLVDSRIGMRSLAPGATEERDLSWLDTSDAQALSDDGKTLIFEELSSGEGRNPAIYLRGTDGSPAVRLGYGNRPALSPDGKLLLCIRRDGNASHLLLLPTGPGESRTLPDNGIRPQAAEWFPDGRKILVTGDQANQPVRTFIEELASGKTKPVTAPGVRASAVSPDGHTVVVVTAAGKVYLYSLATGAERAIATVDPSATALRWDRTGRYLFLLERRGELLERSDSPAEAILRLDVSTGRGEVWRQLRTPDLMASFFHTVALSGDGRAYAFSYQRDLSTLYLVKGVQ
jgi:eukaryotic-like serine/threonine-protein kinase